MKNELADTGFILTGARESDKNAWVDPVFILIGAKDRQK